MKPRVLHQTLLLPLLLVSWSLLATSSSCRVAAQDDASTSTESATTIASNNNNATTPAPSAYLFSWWLAPLTAIACFGLGLFFFCVLRKVRDLCLDDSDENNSAEPASYVEYPDMNVDMNTSNMTSPVHSARGPNSARPQHLTSESSSDAVRVRAAASTSGDAAASRGRDRGSSFGAVSANSDGRPYNMYEQNEDD